MSSWEFGFALCILCCWWQWWVNNSSSVLFPTKTFNAQVKSITEKKPPQNFPRILESSNVQYIKQYDFQHKQLITYLYTLFVCLCVSVSLLLSIYCSDRHHLSKWNLTWKSHRCEWEVKMSRERTQRNQIKMESNETFFFLLSQCHFFFLHS